MRTYEGESETEESDHSELERRVVRVSDLFKERKDNGTWKYIFLQ